MYYDLINQNRLKLYIELNTQNRMKAKHGDKDGKAFYKLMKSASYDKTTKNLINVINVKLINNKNYYLLNETFLRYSMNRIHSSYQKIGAYEINKSYLS